MSSDSSSERDDAAATPGASPATASGSNAVAFYSDLRCPWARVAVHRLLGAAERLGAESVLDIDHRWFPLGDESNPSDVSRLDQELDAVRALEPDLRWHRWSAGGTAFPEGSRLAAAWVQGAKRVSPSASVALDRALREALFADGRDIGDEAVLAEVTGKLDGIDVDAVRAEVESGRADAELEHHVELVRSELVPASPTIVLGDGTSWTNPGVQLEEGDGPPVVQADEPGAYDDIVEEYLERRHYD